MSMLFLKHKLAQVRVYNCFNRTKTNAPFDFFFSNRSFWKISSESVLCRQHSLKDRNKLTLIWTFFFFRIVYT